jgi:hypothetical protein
MKIGYSVFGKAYEYMFRNDLHDKNSIDHTLLKNMILIDENSKSTLYNKPHSISSDICLHELYELAQKHKGKSLLESINNTFDFVNEVVNKFDTPFEKMIFGGTEMEIINRGSDWCTDISRVGASLLQCLGIPSRIVILLTHIKHTTDIR